MTSPGRRAYLFVVLVFQSIADASASGLLRGGAVAIGNFDGVHLGHRALLDRARALAATQGAAAGVLTFEPHPVRVLRPQLAPPLLTSLSRRLELLEEAGVAGVVVQHFDEAYAATPAAGFVERDLHRALRLRDVVVGWDFTAGHERARPEALRQLLAARGIALHVIDPVGDAGLTASSTKIREFLLEGKVEAAASLLRRPHDVDGVVRRGAGRGRAIGFGTANVATDELLPAQGVYAARARLGTGPTAVTHDGVCNVGVKPTVDGSGQVGAEVHLFDFDGRDLYGSPIRLAFLARLRDERRFASVDELRAQISRDVEAARRRLSQ